MGQVSPMASQERGFPGRQWAVGPGRLPWHCFPGGGRFPWCWDFLGCGSPAMAAFPGCQHSLLAVSHRPRTLTIFPLRQGEMGLPGQKGSKGDKGEVVSAEGLLCPGMVLRGAEQLWEQGGDRSSEAGDVWGLP